MTILRVVALFAALAGATLPARASAPDTGRILFQAIGEWDGADRIHDGDPSTSARAETSTVQTLLLLDEEQILRAVRIHRPENVRRVTVSFSKDVLAWSVPAVEAREDAARRVTEISFAPEACRAVMVKIESAGGRASLGEIELVSADRSRNDVYAVTFADVTENAAVIRWKTTLPTKTSLLYGFRPDKLDPLGDLSYELTTDHVARLQGLLPGMDYRVWILMGLERAAGATDSRPFTFRTRGTPYPVAYNPAVTLGRDTIMVHCQSNIPSRASLLWRIAGTSAEREVGAEPAGRFTLDHSLPVEGLRPRTTYEYQILTRDSSGRATATPWFDVTTLAFNVARGRPATGTFTQLIDEQKEDPRSALTRVTDGRNDFFTGMATSGDPTETDQWVEVDLGEAIPLESIETVWRGNAYPTNFYVSVSADGTAWEFPGFGLNAASGAFERSSRGDPLLRVPLPLEPVVPVRFIRVFVPRGSSSFYTRFSSWRFIQLAELEAHAAWPASGTAARSGREERGR